MNDNDGFRRGPPGMDDGAPIRGRGSQPADDATRPRLSRASPEQMRLDVENNPDLAAALRADVFAGRFCVRCGSRGALFATPVWHGSCPRCLAGRMRALLAERVDLPWWVRYLAKQGESEADRQDRAHMRSLQVEFDDFHKCGRCGKLIPKKDARYPVIRALPNGPIPPHCVSCWAVVSAEEAGGET